MTQDAVIQTHELTKHYRHPFFTWIVKARALTDLTLEVGRGEVFGLLGPNGSGKSTTIKLILGLVFPSSGQVSVFGGDPRRLDAKRRLGYLPEESTLYRFLDPEETLDFYGRLFGLERRERRRRVDSLLDLVGLREQRRRPVGEFSKGMKRRVGLAQCLINDPELVILDEPTTGMDPIGTAEIKDLIRALRDKGKTVLLCTHMLSEVEDLCDRVTIRYGGKQLVTGRLADLVRQGRKVRITGELDEGTLTAVQALIRDRLGADAAIEVGPTVERLEDFFLRTIEEARAAGIQTSGAGATTKPQALDFLLNSGPAGLLETLTQQEATAPPMPVVLRVAAAQSEPDAGVLSTLSGVAQAESVRPDATARTNPEPTSALGPRVDLLDRLRDGEEG